jgi:arginase family enzyme
VQVRVLDLDGGIALQPRLNKEARLCAAQDWGPHIRMACSFGRFRRFEGALRDRLGGAEEREPFVTFVGSGDFHHVSLALIRRLRTPFNLLILDNHPDWMRGVPFMHCGTWVYHAAQLPLLGTIFHAGGDVDFDNYYQWLAPWRLLRSGKIRVLPGTRKFVRRGWASVPNQPLRVEGVTLSPARLAELLQPFRQELRQRPLYISLDKDVMHAGEAVVNWDSGHLTLANLHTVLKAFLEASGRRFAGMDIVGDWSPVRLRGCLRRLMHVTEHPRLEVDPAQATRQNEQINLALLDCLGNNLAPTKALQAG